MTLARSCEYDDHSDDVSILFDLFESAKVTCSFAQDLRELDTVTHQSVHTMTGWWFGSRGAQITFQLVRRCFLNKGR